MAPQPKGKQGTKGSKQIVDENVGTLSFYRNMALGSGAAYLIINFLCYEITVFFCIMSTISLGILFASYQFMRFMSRAQISETGAIIDSGVDLNMEGGIAEHVKDLIILISSTLFLTLISNYFWFQLLLIPCQAIWKLWGTIIKPWLAQKNQTPEIDEKKQKKMEKKMKRMR